MRHDKDRLAQGGHGNISLRCIGPIHRADTQPPSGWVDSSPELTGQIMAGAEADHGRRSEQEMSSQRAGVLELAVLGLLHETPMHGYELRKRLNSVLGAFRAFGYGSLYPCLKDLTGR